MKSDRCWIGAIVLRLDFDAVGALATRKLVSLDCVGFHLECQKYMRFYSSFQPHL